jgi:hypothetical protein
MTDKAENNEQYEDIFTLIHSNDTKQVVDGLLALTLNVDDFELKQKINIAYSTHENENIRGIAVLCLGHMARIHRKADKKLVYPVIQRALQDGSAFVRGHADSALDDTIFFVNQT